MYRQYKSLQSLPCPQVSGRFSGTNGAFFATRITVKGMFDVYGHRASLGSRNYLALSERSQKAAPAIQRLHDCGTTLVGMTQLCALIGE